MPTAFWMRLIWRTQCLGRLPMTCGRQIKRIQKGRRHHSLQLPFWFGDLEHARVLRSMETFAARRSCRLSA